MPRSVLIVDDEPAITVALMTRLQAHGYEVNHALNGLAGVEAAALHLPDAIVMDIRMPDISGFDAFERIRRLPQLERTPIVFLSAHAQESARRQAMEIGAAGFLTKPYEAADVIAALESAMADQPEIHGEVGHA
ncbi:MAG: response regulator [Planctomycetota bacterium]